ncbi:MAG: Mo-dependent nitrogenase C-terminal domain-containing protein [Cyanobacteriota bacterium]|nr:Mo-dependent nitrogenase C-terminal domain-containing protein [Cyanobacteriota bacterium]
MTDPSSPPVSARDRSADLARRQLWLGALHHLALADGDFSPAEERVLTEELRLELSGARWEALPLPGTEALVHRFGPATPLAEAFLRSAVVVALADGHLSPPEMALLRQWSEALKVGEAQLAALPDTCCDSDGNVGLLEGLKAWLEELDPVDPAVARFLVRLIPAQCPFERDVRLFGHKLVHIPPMCKINPLYEQLVGLRLRCLTTLEERRESPASADAAPGPQTP